MIAIILAAGMGKRISKHYNEVPKILIEINKKPLLEYHLMNLKASGIDDIIIITGYKHELIIEKSNELGIKYNVNIKCVYNKYYSTHNNSVSLNTGLKFLQNVREDLIIVNGDDLYDVRILNKLISSYTSSIIVDTEKNLTFESFKVVLKNGKISMMGKNIDIGESLGEFIGISKIVSGDLELYSKIINDIACRNPNEYYDISFIDLNINKSVGIVNTENYLWTEIDFKEDLEYGESIAEKIKFGGEE